MFRTTGFNSIRTLVARLQYYQAISGNRLACLPLELRLRGKSTRQSHGTPIFYADITIRNRVSIEEALLAAKQLDESRQSAEFDQAALDNAARQGLANGAFEDNEEDSSAVIEEFYPTTETPTATTRQTSGGIQPSLAEKLERQIREQEPSTA